MRKKFLFVFILNCVIFTGCVSLVRIKKIPELQKAHKDDILTVYASNEIKGYPAKNAVDGNKKTCWKSVDKINSAWYVIELKKEKVLNSIKIFWGNTSAKEYDIKVSRDGNNWVVVGTVNDGGEEEVRELKFDFPVVTKYIEIFCKKNNNVFGYSICEIELNPIILPLENKIEILDVTTSSDNEDTNGKNAVDGNIYTRWESKHGIDPSWIELKLNKRTQICAIKIFWETASAKKYKIQVSNDRRSWKTVAKVTNGKKGEERIVVFDPVWARYVRIYCEKRTTQWGYSIWEIELYHP
jgi:hypothetical protein